MRFITVLTVLSTLCASGCVSYWKGKEMQSDIVALQGQVEQLTDDQRTVRKKLDDSSKSLSARLANLDKSLTDAIGRIRSNSADAGVVLDELQQEIAVLRGEIATFQHKNTQAATTGAPVVDAPIGAPQLPEDKAELYRYGYERKQANDCPEAIRAFLVLSERFPKYSRTDNGLALAAECQFQAKKYGASLRTLKLITEKYKKGDKYDDALFMMAENFSALGQCKQALIFLETVVAEYPTSNRHKEAKRKLKATKKSCK